MEYKNNWPVYIQGRSKCVKSEVGVGNPSEVCVGVAKKQTDISKLDIALARAECNKREKQKVLPLDVLMGKLIQFQRSSNLNTACRARKAAAELASERKRLAFLCSTLKKQGKDTHIVMQAENRKALALFKARWASLLGV